MLESGIRILRKLPFWDLHGVSSAEVGRDAVAAVGVTFLSVPQAIAYAMIAGLPPVMGLYAAALPAAIGGLFRSSPQVVTGPSNALSLLVGATLASQSDHPASAAAVLALWVGVMQLGAGLLRLGTLVDFISRPVVFGYITGAGVLIGVGQLSHVTQTSSEPGHILRRLLSWMQTLDHAHLPSVALAFATAALVVALRRFNPRIPGAVVAMVAGIALTYLLGDGAGGLLLVHDVAPVPTGLVPFVWPDLSLSVEIMPAAAACAVLSLVESSSVATAAAAESGHRLNRSVEFTGQGLANVTAAFFGGYPTSGSLARTALARQLGGRTRIVGVLSGLLMVVVLLSLGPVVDHTPIASLAGLLLVIAYDLVNVPALKTVWRGRPGDRIALFVTILGTWSLRLDHAIYLGVLISLVSFLRRARMLSAHEMVVTRAGRLREVEMDEAPGSARCPAIRIVHLEGSLFFAAATELEQALSRFLARPEVKVVVVRLKRTQGADVTTSLTFKSLAERYQAAGKHLILAGIRPRTLALLKATGVVETVGEANVFPTEPGWFVAMERGIARARTLVGAHECEACPVDRMRRRTLVTGSSDNAPPGPQG